MKPTIIAALCLAAVSASAETSGPRCAAVADGAPREWTCLTGSAAGAKAGELVLRDAEAWSRFWTRATGQDAAPSVDFKTSAVAVLVSPGEGKTSLFRAVKVAAGGGDKAAVLAAGSYLRSADKQAAAEEKAAKLLGSWSAGSASSSGGSAWGRALAALRGFDSGLPGAGLRDAVAASPAPSSLGLGGLFLAQAGCTPGVDCPSAPRNGPSCTPGVDCPGGGGQQPRGCTPGVDCPGGGGRTPLPPNYQPRPSGAPSYYPPVGDPRTYDNSVASGWSLYVDRWGRAVETVGDWSEDVARARVDRGGSEVGSQGSSYNARLVSEAERPVYRVYWRWVGSNCDPNDASRCLNWDVQYARFIDRRDSRESAATVDVRFNDGGQKLLPWERETIFVSYDGSRIGYDASGAAFRYSVRGPIIDQQTGRALIEFTAGDRIRRQPESDKVIARLEKSSSGQLQIVIVDRRASFYDGEPLDISFQVKKDSGSFWHRDKVAAERSQRDPVRINVNGGQETQTAIPVSSLGSGAYFITGWSFRRAQSKISTDGWIDQGKGPKVQY